MRTVLEIERDFAKPAVLETAERLYFVGIGGASMSALARICLTQGARVAGTDLTASNLTAELISLGAEVRIGHSGADIRPGDVLILTDAIDLETSPEVATARDKGVPLLRRSQLLNWLLRDYTVLAVTGTHGKTTTTGLLGAALIAAGLDPFVVCGAEIPEWGSAVRYPESLRTPSPSPDGEGAGGGELQSPSPQRGEGTGVRGEALVENESLRTPSLTPVGEGAGDGVSGNQTPNPRFAVIEACEAYDSLRDIDPDWVILTNLEPEHLDFYTGGWPQIRDTLTAFANRAKGLIYCAEDEGAREIANLVRTETIPYELEHEFEVGIPGEKNRLNASGVRALCRVLSIDGDKGLASFQGADRRMQFLGTAKGVDVWDDYAHHPTEIAASLEAIRQRAKGRVVAVFQPHLYSRTKDNLAEFATALDAADFVVVTDIYPAREDPIPGVSSARIAEKIDKPCRYVPSRHLLPREVARWVKEGDTVIAMGAGNISDFAPAFLGELQRSGPKKVLVAYGGDSAEREVSLHSGRAIAEALKQKGYEVDLQDLTELLFTTSQPPPPQRSEPPRPSGERGQGVRGEALIQNESLRTPSLTPVGEGAGDGVSGNRTQTPSPQGIYKLIGPNRPDLVFLATHGTNAEDGALQGLCKLLHLPYTGSDILSSALAMDKDRAKIILAEAGIRVPKGVLVRKSDPLPDLEPPLVVKPNANGSTVGVSFLDSTAGLERAIDKALAYDDAVLVEERILGMEISTPVLGDRALSPVEIVPGAESYDFEAKYTPGATTEICPARLPKNLLDEAKDIAVKAHQALGCQGATRTDAFVKDNGEIVVLEVNTLPGMTGTSLLPNSAAESGMTFPDLCAWIAEDALRRHAQA